MTKFEERLRTIAMLSVGQCPTCEKYGVEYSEELDQGLRFYYHDPECGTWQAQMFRRHIIIDATRVLEDV